VNIFLFFPTEGSLWRLCANRRDDKRLEGLTGKLSGCLSSPSLSKNEVQILRKWIEDSYDYSDEINEIIESNPIIFQEDDEEVDDDQNGETKQSTLSSPSRLDIGYIVLEETLNIPDATALRSMARAPLPGVLAKVQQVLSHLLVVTTSTKKNEVDLSLLKNKSGDCLYLPLSMTDNELFTCLPHLLSTGTKFSLKPAALMAILVLRTAKKRGNATGDQGNEDDTLLQARARRFLLNIKGKWLPPVDNIDRPEILSYEFINFLSNAPHPGMYDVANTLIFVCFVQFLLIEN